MDTQNSENIKVRGTLATTTFEKESVNAVGGQLFVANSTAITGSGGVAAEVTATSMSVVNAQFCGLVKYY